MRLDSNGVASTSLTIDGTPVSKVYGPYGDASGVNFSGVFGTLSAGSHNYTITVTDNLANSSQYTDTFSIAPLTIDASTPPHNTISCKTWV